MFKSRTSKKNSKLIVSDLLENYLDVKDTKNTKSKISNASKINKIKVDSNLTNSKRSEIKRKRTRERKNLNKKIILKSKEDDKILMISKLNDKDNETVNLVLNEKLSKLNEIDSLNDSELIQLQNEVFQLRKKSLNVDQVHESILSNRERNERKVLNHMKRDDAIVGITPGLAMPGESDDESDEDDDDGQQQQQQNQLGDDNLSNFKDDFDDYS